MIASIKLTDGLYRGPRPDAITMRSLNLKTMLNLEAGWYEALHPRAPREMNVAHEMGIIEVRIPMSDFAPPCVKRVAHALRLMQQSHMRPLLVHCHSGVDRTGVVCAAFRAAVQGWPPVKALNEMLTLGFHRVRYCWWLPFVRRLLASKQLRTAALGAAAA